MTTRRPRFAEGTTTSVETSRAELTAILTKNGVRRMGWYGDADAGDELHFEYHGGQYRMRITRPTDEETRTAYSHLYAPQVDWIAKREAEWRRRWRATVLLLKAKMEFIDGGDTTADRELMPYRVLQDGRTLEEAIAADGLPLLTEGSR